MSGYKKIKQQPLTQEELEEKLDETKEELQIVEDWVKEEENKLKADKFKTHQSKSACKRNLAKAKKRVNNVKGMIGYWKNRVNGMTHFRASIELNEYWASLKNKKS
ncbi:MAG: hypothetical protein OQK82_02215 [Candidatus Pacearchaeota archaeon]|nr:hypothetical protein [Candidatus Pacearchaeota archaeon]